MLFEKEQLEYFFVLHAFYSKNIELLTNRKLLSSYQDKSISINAMNIEELRSYCLTKKGVTESFPFGPDTLVFKVCEKVFLLTGLDSHPLSFNTKCDPERAVDLREQYPNNIFPGYHMNKKHWNTIEVGEELTQAQLQELIDHSYDLVVRSLPKKTRESI